MWMITEQEPTILGMPTANFIQTVMLIIWFIFTGIALILSIAHIIKRLDADINNDETIKKTGEDYHGKS